MPTERQRREAERRRLQRQLQRRAEREARRRTFTLIASIVGTIVIIAIVVTAVVATSSDKSTPAAGGATTPAPTTSTPTSTPTTAATYPCTWTPSGTAARQVGAPPTTTPPKSGKVDLLVSTSQGPITFQLDRSAAPCAVESFTSLTEQHFFDRTSCHRLTSGVLNVVQCGDPTGTGRGGPGYSFADELTGKEKYTRGVIAMANGGPNTNGSQFFIVYKNSTLGPNYTIFGHVTSGLKIVDKVAAKGSTPAGDGKPKLALTLNSVSVVQ